MNKNVKKIGRSALSGVLVLGMVFCNSAFVEAKKVSKKESVYVTAGSDGAVSQITVSDWLKDSGLMTGTISDQSDLTDITNVKGEEKFTQSGESVEWNASKQDIYYQGKSSAELPVGVAITYSLDGEEMSAEDMVGKSGKMEMHVAYTNKSKQKKKVNGKEVTVYTPFVMVTGMILSSDTFSHVEIDNGRVISDGSKEIVVGLGVPGLAESLDLDGDAAENVPSDFTVTADVIEFSMGNTFTFASPSLLDELDLDDSDTLDELEDKLDDLTDAASELVDGSDTLSDNMSLFHDKMGELRKKAKKYEKDGVKKVTSGIKDLAKNGNKLVSGVNQYTDGAASLAKGAKAYVDGAGKIASGNSKLYDAVKDLPGQLNTFDSGLSTYTAAVDKMGSKENVKKLKEGTKAVSDGITAIHENLETLEKSYDYNQQVIDGLVQLEQAYTAAGMDVSDIKKLRTSLETVTEQQKTGIQQLKAATSAAGDLKKGADAVTTGVGTVMDSLSTLSGNSSTLTDASSKLKGSMPALVASVKELKEGGEELTKNNKSLKSGANQVTKAGKTMKSSAKKLNKGMKKLNQGGKSLNSATSQLIQGIVKLDVASGKLENGSSQLAEGMVEFNNKGIRKLENTYEEDFKTVLDRLDAVLAAGRDYKSFSGLGKAMDGEVKFIIETESVDAD